MTAKTMTAKTDNAGPLVDELGRVQAQITALEMHEKNLKKQLKEVGDGAYEGKLFRATIVTAEYASINKDAMVAKLTGLGVPHQWFAANTDRSSRTTIKVVARNGERVEA
jgi:hypothetical protein